MPITEMIEASPIAALITDPRLPDNPIIASNAAFERLTGYSADEIVGRNCRFLSGKASQPELRQLIEEAVRERRPLLTEVENFRKDGTLFRNALLIAPVFDDNGELAYFLGSQEEVRQPQLVAEPEHRLAARRRFEALPRRQRQVLAAMLEGKRNKQIAYELGIVERTVKLHRAAALAALGVRSNAEAIRMAVEAGWS